MRLIILGLGRKGNIYFPLPSFLISDIEKYVLLTWRCWTSIQYSLPKYPWYHNFFYISFPLLPLGHLISQTLILPTTYNEYLICPTRMILRLDIMNPTSQSLVVSRLGCVLPRLYSPLPPRTLQGWGRAGVRNLNIHTLGTQIHARCTCHIPAHHIASRRLVAVDTSSSRSRERFKSVNRGAEYVKGHSCTPSKGAFLRLCLSEDYVSVCRKLSR